MVPEERLLKLTEENLQKQKMLIEAYKLREQREKEAEEAKQKAKTASGSGGTKANQKESGSGGGPRGTKRGRETELEEDWLKRPEIKIPIPDALKVHLVDDWEAITKENRVRTAPLWFVSHSRRDSRR